MAARVRGEHFKLTRGELSSFDRPGSNGHTFTNSFCGQCGTRIHHVSSRFPDLISLKPGTFDETGWLQPEFHVYTRSAQPWITIAEETPAFETMPADPSIFAGKKE